MSYLWYSAINNQGERFRRLGQYAGLDELDKELTRYGEQLLNYQLLSDSMGKTLEFFRPKPKPLEIAEFCTTLSYFVAGGVDLQGALADLRPERQ